MNNNYNKKKSLLLFLIFIYTQNNATITFHTPQSSINLSGTKTQIAIVPNDIVGWKNKTIIKEPTKSGNIKTESNFTGDTLKQESAQTELSRLNENTIFGDKFELNLKESLNYGNAAYSASWRPDGNFLAIGGLSPTSGNELQIYSFNGTTLSLVDSKNYGSTIRSVSWSPNGNYLAIGGNSPISGNELEIYSFNGTSLSLITSKNYGSTIYSIDWRPDGNYLAIGGNSPTSGNELEVYSFNGTSLSLITGKNYGTTIYSVNWRPDGNYLAIGGDSPVSGNEFEIYSFNGTTLSLIIGKNYGASIYSLQWSHSGNFFAIGGYDPVDYAKNELQIYSFNGTSISFITSKNYGSIIYSISWNYNDTYLGLSGTLPESGKELEIYSFNETDMFFITNKNYGNRINSTDWHPSNNTIAIGGNNPDTGHEEIEVYKLDYYPEYNTNDSLIQDVINNSNTIIQNGTDIINNSNVIIKNKQNIKNNSNAIIKLNNSGTYDDLQTQINNLEDDVRYNSNAIISNDTSSLSEYITGNSNAILTLDPLTKQNSNSIVTQNNTITQNSNAIVSIDQLTIQNSNTATTNKRMVNYNSNSIVTIDKLTKQNSNTAITNDSDIHYNSQSTITNYPNIKYNSNAIVTIDGNSDTTDLQNQINNNDTDIKNNSNAIVTNNRNISTNKNDITSNKNDISTNYENISLNTTTIQNHNSQITNNENNITTNTDGIKNNSNAIIKLDSTSTSGLQVQVDDNKEKIKNNSNSIVTLSVEKGETIITQGPITNNLTLEESSFINPDKKIEIDGDVILDGNGAVLVFGGTDEPQFIVNPGKTVTLKNIQLLRINQQTFHLNFRSYLNGSTWNIDDAKIIIGENVLFGLSENITFSQGLIEIVNNNASESQTFKIKGIEGQKQFNINPSDRYSNALSIGDNGLTWNERKEGKTSRETPRLTDRFTLNQTIPVLLKSNDNTLSIENIKLSGFEHITQSETELYKGKLALLGKSEVDIGDYTFNDFEKNKDKKEEYNTNLFIQGLNNKLRLLKDDLKLSGELRFSNFGENSIEIKTMLTETIIPKSGDLKRNIPQVNFGTNFIELTSTLGLAKLIFGDNRIRIKNDTNAFNVYGNSLLQGKSIEITGDSIQDLYDSSTGKNEFILNTYELIGLSDINYKPIVQTNYKMKKYKQNKKNYYIIKKSGIDLIYEKEIDKILNS